MLSRGKKLVQAALKEAINALGNNESKQIPSIVKSPNVIEDEQLHYDENLDAEVNCSLSGIGLAYPRRTILF